MMKMIKQMQINASNMEAVVSKNNKNNKNNNNNNNNKYEGDGEEDGICVNKMKVIQKYWME